MEAGQENHGNVYQFQKALIEANSSLHQKGVTSFFFLFFGHFFTTATVTKKKLAHG